MKSECQAESKKDSFNNLPNESGKVIKIFKKNLKDLKNLIKLFKNDMNKIFDIFDFNFPNSSINANLEY